jgi:hypothetical protein
MIVGALLIGASSLSTINVKNEADLQKLKNIADYVAIRSLELVSSTKTNNLTAEAILNVPNAVGNQRYWLRLENDSLRSWVDIGFGVSPQPSRQLTYIPSQVSASGAYASGAGMPVLRCYLEGSVTYLEISGGS